jgi:phosphoribosylformylglycinamidine cyclo-ligase
MHRQTRMSPGCGLAATFRFNSGVTPAPADPNAYASAGVDTRGAGRAIDRLVEVLRSINPGRERRTVLRTGHYASVIALDDRLGLALCTDGVGTKLIVAEQARRFDTVGIDCVAMNVNDLVCVGAKPQAMVDYIAVEQADPEVLKSIGEGLKAGAERAGIEIHGGELAQLPEMIKGHPSPFGIDLVGAAVGTVELDRIVSGNEIAPGDAVLGLPSSGIHSNGLTLARKALFELGGLSLDDEPAEIGRTLADELLEPTEIYVPAVIDLLGSGLDVHGLAHITGDGLLNLLRLSDSVGYLIDAPLPTHPIFDLVRSLGGLSSAEMHEVFNMGTGFCCIVAKDDCDRALAHLREHYPEARRIGEATAEAGVVRVPSAGVEGDAEGFRDTGS